MLGSEPGQLQWDRNYSLKRSDESSPPYLQMCLGRRQNCPKDQNLPGPVSYSKLKFFTAPESDRILRKLHRTDGNLFRVPSTHRSRCIPMTETLKVGLSWERQPCNCSVGRALFLADKCGQTINSEPYLDQMFDRRFLVLAKDSMSFQGRMYARASNLAFISVDTTYTVLTKYIYLLTRYITWLYIPFSLARNKPPKK